jgi:hypoxanthine-DNA glycosylase
MHHCFPPVIREDTRLLVLGSLPGRASLAAGQYYAHPRNLFWRLIGAAIGRELEPLGYEMRLASLLDAKVGLWDAVASAERPGSLDANIRLHEASDLAALAAGLPDLRAIAFNGAMAAKIGRKELGDGPAFTLIDLPSSSPAYVSLAYAKKCDAWEKLREFIHPSRSA